MKIVKVWLSIVLLFCIGLSGNCQKNTFDLKCKFEVIKETSLPYERVLTDKGQRNPSYGLVADKEIPCSLLFEYIDFGVLLRQLGQVAVVFLGYLNRNQASLFLL